LKRFFSSNYFRWLFLPSLLLRLTESKCDQLHPFKRFVRHRSIVYLSHRCSTCVCTVFFLSPWLLVSSPPNPRHLSTVFEPWPTAILFCKLGLSDSVSPQCCRVLIIPREYSDSKESNLVKFRTLICLMLF